ncbi:ABC-F family ATP-binding cassette domain-containing protein [Propionimicrobium lymphophilum]|uniref:ABC-F family ATP-binding cassette domain-containing protein n=1 Tax=Propionimicrobium lymphophilum TaxID=33012 RepID=UPI0023F10ED6|nr:ABC-F family ATP-binding cassette domain-containing protein [Propionimicrobium lymphophilum]
MAHLLGAQNLGLSYPTKQVFDSVTLGISDGDRVGIVGRNGDGKSSLLGMLTGRIEPDSGQVTYRSDLRVGELTQRDELDGDISVGRSIVGDVEEYVWASDPRIRDVITGLVPDLDWDKPVGQLSGGQRRRVALAKLLVDEWDVIALDEPTNHLDIEGVNWLAEHLKNRWPKNTGGLLVITHDRWFLDEVATTTWEVHDQIVEPFEGGYAAYVLQRVERDRIAAATEAKRQNIMRKELAWLRRGAPARTSKPKFRIEAANELIANVPEPRNKIELSRLSMARLGKRVVDLLDVDVSYGDHQVLHGVNWKIAPGERSGILGANGAGKSTLLGLICGTIEASSGSVRRGKTVKFGVLDQQFSALAEIGTDRVREVLSRTQATFDIGGKELTPAQLLERLGFSSAHLSAFVNDLSGGQKRRLQLLMVLLSEPNVLVLDEPTNDVDTDMLAAVEDVLDTWPGTLLVVSHDRYLIERITDQQYAILGGTLRHLPGGVDEYLRLAKKLDDGEVPAPLAAEGPTKQLGPSSADLRAQRKEIEAVERKIKRLSASQEKLEAQMEDHDPSDYVWLTEQGGKLVELQEQISELEDKWLELNV